MRLHRLVIEGIGPYAERQELDLDALAAHGLFLLTGPTGAGKSTVLDAIVFALFGTVAGARGGHDKHERHRAKRGIVSDLRTIDTTPGVELEFTLGERRLLVRRSPEHERPALRGGGTTTAKQAASLSELTDEGWQQRSTDFAEISNELQDLLGMNAEQFSQVVLLPQGQFAGFLRAPVKERRAILERLFRVDRYQAAEQWLEDAARAAREGEAAATGALRELVAHLAGALGSRAGEPPEAELPAVSAWIEQQRFDAEGLAEVTAVDLTSAASRAQASAAALQRAKSAEAAAATLAERRTELTELGARLDRAQGWIETTRWSALAADRERWDDAVEQAQAHAAELKAAVAEQQRAAELGRRADAARTDGERAEQEAQEAQARVPELTEQLEAARSAVTAAEQAQATLAMVTREHERLQTQLAAVRQAAELAEQRATARRHVDTAQDDVTRHEAELATFPEPAHLDAESAQIAAAQREASSQHATAQAQLQDADRALQQLELRAAQITALQERRPPLEAALRRATDAAQDARATYLAVRERRLEAMAAELAADLTDDAPCPVCGSHEHPAPAPPHHDGDLRAAETQAAEEADDAGRLRVEAERALTGVDADLAALDVAALDGDRAAAQARRSELRHAVAAAAEQTRAHDAAAQAHRELIGRRRAAADAVAAARTSLSAAREQLAALDQRVAAIEARLPEDPDGARTRRDALAEELASLQRAIASAPAHRDRAVAAEQRLEAARARAASQREAAAGHRRNAEALAAEQAALQQELRERRGEESPDLEEAATAARDTARALGEAARLRGEQPALARTVDQLRQQVSELLELPGEQRAEDDELARLAHDAVGVAQAAAVAAGDQLAAAQRDAADAERCLRAASDAAAQLGELAERLGPAAEQAERLRRLDATVRGQGDNTRRISLTTYVLAARLEQVAAAATTHLERMSSGRYALCHHDERYGNGPAGLGLRVRDAWSGEERDTATLSGGESFQASLALALGLAEVVQHEAGGRRLDTLLVDEGFGSLDPDALEEVMSELDELRASGRVIGLVSHVPAMADRIHSQLRVRPSRSGSVAEVVLGTTVA